MKKIKIKKTRNDAILPTKGSKYAAGWDAYAAVGPTPLGIGPGETVMVDTGISVEIPEDTWLGIFARSGLATKSGLRPANCTGVVDADYRGPVMVALHNDSDMTRVVSHGERVAQLILMPMFETEIEEVSELSETERGEGGFGSTGK